MEKLVKQMGELVASLQEAKAEVEKEKSLLATEVTKTHKLSDELIKKKGELEAREQKVAEQEKPLQILEEAKKIQAENKETLAAIESAQKAFAKERAEFNTKVAKDRAELGAAQQLFAKEMEVFKADRKQLIEKEKTYKDDVLNKLKAVK